MNQKMELETFYPHLPERVWQALTDRRALNIWSKHQNAWYIAGKSNPTRIGGYLESSEIVAPPLWSSSRNHLGSESSSGR
jgi:uncharacterized protein YndB with AHSA1/START domain